MEDVAYLGLLEDGAPDPPAGKCFTLRMRNEYITEGRRSLRQLVSRRKEACMLF